MDSPESEKDEPLTPAGRLFLRPELDQVINSVVGVKHPIDVSAMKSTVANSFVIRHPRFSSLLVRDHRGVEHWRKTDIDLDRHIISVDSIPGDGDDAINDYIADLTVSSPLSTDKPLWEIHLLSAQKCTVVRLHHALGDGISLMSMLLSGCRRADDPDALPSIPSLSKGGRGKNGREKNTVLIWGFLKVLWFTVVFVFDFIKRCLWVKDKTTAVSGGAGVELWPRKLATARFLIDDMKMVKEAVADATINDVLFGVISSGLSRYLDLRSPNALQAGLQMTGVAMVNLRKQTGLQEMSNLMKENSKAGWGNKFGVMLLPVYYHKSVVDPLQYLKVAKTMIDKKKHSLEAYFSYIIGDLVMSYLGPKFASMLNYRILCNTTFTISNVMGPQEEITMADAPVTYLRVTSSSLPHAITMHMVSYAGRADMQILVAKDIIPNPKILARCFEDALLEMKEAVVATTKV